MSAFVRCSATACACGVNCGEITGASGRGVSAGFSGSDDDGVDGFGRVGVGSGAGVGGCSGATVGGGAVVVCGSLGGAGDEVAAGGGVETEGVLAFTMLRWQPATQKTRTESVTANTKRATRDISSRAIVGVGAWEFERAFMMFA
jgi:hypothetical protein